MLPIYPPTYLPTCLPIYVFQTKNYLSTFKCIKSNRYVKPIRWHAIFPTISDWVPLASLQRRLAAANPFNGPKMPPLRHQWPAQTRRLCDACLIKRWPTTHKRHRRPTGRSASVSTNVWSTFAKCADWRWRRKTWSLPKPTWICTGCTCLWSSLADLIR